MLSSASDIQESASGQLVGTVGVAGLDESAVNLLLRGDPVMRVGHRDVLLRRDHDLQAAADSRDIDAAGRVCRDGGLDAPLEETDFSSVRLGDARAFGALLEGPLAHLPAADVDGQPLDVLLVGAAAVVRVVDAADGQSARRVGTARPESHDEHARVGVRIVD